MRPKVTVITIGVEDLDRSLRFYRDGLGLPAEGIIGKEFEYGTVVFIELQAGLRLALWPRKSIAHDTGLEAAAPSPTEFTLGQMCLPGKRLMPSWTKPRAQVRAS